MTYDTNDRLTNITSTGGKWLSFTYDTAGRRTSSVDQLGHQLTYSYDTAGRLESMTNELGQFVVRYEYDAAGRLLRKTLGNGMVATYGYDAAGQLLTLTNRLADGTPISWFNYTYDTRGRRIAMATHYGTWAYDYDDLGQLTHAVLTSTDPDIPSQDLAYVYDALGNRIRTIENGVTTEYTANNLNQYVSVGDTDYVFDLDGNLIQETSPSGTTTYTYNDENRLIAVSKGADTWEYAYDALGNRVATTENGVTKRFVIDPIGLGNVGGEYDGAGNLLAHCDHGLGLLSRTDAGGNPAYYTFDAIGNAQQLVGAAGVVTNAYAYTPFGALLRNTETLPNPFQFVGELGVMRDRSYLSFMRARYFNAQVGRFLNGDPLGSLGGINPYSYIGNSALNAIDPSGLLRINVNWVSPESVAQGFVDFGDDAAGWMDVRYGNWGGGSWSGGQNTKPGQISAPTTDWSDSKDWADQWFKLHDLMMYLKLQGVEGYKNRDVTLELKRLIEQELGWRDPSRRTDFGRLEQVELYRLQVMRNTLLKELLEAYIKSGGSVKSQASSSVDPNTKSGPAGFGANGFITASGTLAYRVDFENESNATAPAQIVTVTDQLDGDLDWTTFELTEIGFGDTHIAVPAGSQHFETSVPMSYNGVDFEVQIEAGIHLTAGEVYANFYSIDPVTGLPPTVDIGFLPPEDGTGRGQGYFSYTVKPKQGLATGTEIRNVARISFDFQQTIATNQCDPHDPGAGTCPNKECLNTISAGACGDGVVDPIEECDDGNTTGGDGCSANCAVEPGYTCTGSPSVCAPTPTPTATPTPRCFLDVDGSGRPPEVATDIVYIARYLLGLACVPPSFRNDDPYILSDTVIAANINAIGQGLDVDANGVVDVATDIVYIARRLLGLTPVPPSFRGLDPGIPSDDDVTARIDVLCP
jgi:RHS repeat-associated protein